MKSYILLLFLIFSTYISFAQGLKCSHQNLNIFNEKPPIQFNFDIKSYVFDLNLESNSRSISGNVAIQILAKADLQSIELELHDNYTIDSIILKNKVAATKTTQHHFTFPVFAKQDDIFIAKIYYHGSAPLGTNDWGNGIVQKKDLTYGNDVIYSLSVPYFGHEWFPCKQVLTDLIDSVTMKITTDASNTVASNGLKKSDINLGNGKHAVTWHTDYPINYYLINFIVGKYINYNFEINLPGKVDKLPIVNYLYNTNAYNAKKPILDNIENFLTNYSNLFGLYPFDKEKFGTVIVPLSGGMEHQTMINLATNYDKYLLAHEMSHQWFGDNVNVATLHDMWLNEGWATYCEYLTAEKLFPTEAKNYLDNLHNQSFSTSGRVYVADTSNFSNVYNSMVYNKGAVICHTLRDEIGSDSLFFGAVTAVQKSFKNKNIDLPTYKAFVEQYTGKKLTTFFDQWYYGYGYPRHTITFSNKNNILYIRSISQGSNSLTPLFKTKTEFLIKRTNLPDTTVSVYQSQNNQIFEIKNISDVTNIVVDPRNVILNKVVSVKEDITLETEDAIDNKDFTVYPVPAKDVIYVKTTQPGNYTIEIFDINGTKLFIQKMQSESTSIDTSNFSNGEYIVKIQNKKSLLSVKKVMILK